MRPPRTTPSTAIPYTGTYLKTNTDPATGRKSYYFRPDPRHRPAEWTQRYPAAIRLPRDPALRHGRDPDTDPSEYAAAFAEAAPLYETLCAMRGQADAGKPVYPRGSLRWLIEDWKKNGSYRQLEAATRQFYDVKVEHLLKWADDAARASGGIHHHISALTPLGLYKFLSRFDDRPALRNHLRALLSNVFTHAVLYEHVPHNIVREVRLNRLSREKRQRKSVITLWTQGFVDTFAQAALDRGRPEIAAAVLLQWDIGQRPTDLLSITALSRMEYEAMSRGVLAPGFYYNPFDRCVIGWQHKTGSFVHIPLADATLAALDTITPTEGENRRHLIVNPMTGEPYCLNTFGKLFRKIANGIGWKQAQFRQGRHSCIVRYLRVPDVNETMIRTITGHDDIEMIRKKYGVGDSEMAAEAARRRNEYEAG